MAARGPGPLGLGPHAERLPLKTPTSTGFFTPECDI